MQTCDACRQLRLSGRFYIDYGLDVVYRTSRTRKPAGMPFNQSGIELRVCAESIHPSSPELTPTLVAVLRLRISSLDDEDVRWA